jgi:hypothetical protein
MFRPRARHPILLRHLPGFADRILAVAIVALALGPGAGLASEVAEHESEPRLIVPEGSVVRAGQWIDLHWTAAESIVELEVLLSTDGGRTYPVCISPRMDPEERHFVWQVPADAGAEPRLRIRYNRGGREIEGPPTRVLKRMAGDEQPEPLGLPIERAVPRPERSRAPDRDETRVLRSDSSEDDDTTSPTTSATTLPPAISMRQPSRSAASVTNRAPLFIPLRA